MRQLFLSPEEILYIEKVDNKTFVYTDDNEIQVEMSLYSTRIISRQRELFQAVASR